MWVTTPSKSHHTINKTSSSEEKNRATLWCVSTDLTLEVAVGPIPQIAPHFENGGRRICFHLTFTFPFWPILPLLILISGIEEEELASISLSLFTSFTPLDYDFWNSGSRTCFHLTFTFPFLPYLPLLTLISGIEEEEIASISLSLFTYFTPFDSDLYNREIRIYFHLNFIFSWIQMNLDREVALISWLGATHKSFWYRMFFYWFSPESVWDGKISSKKWKYTHLIEKVGSFN